MPYRRTYRRRRFTRGRYRKPYRSRKRQRTSSRKRRYVRSSKFRVTGLTSWRRLNAHTIATRRAHKDTAQFPLVLHGASAGATYNCATAMVSVTAFEADTAKAGRKTRIMQHSIKLRFIIPTPAVGKKQSIRWYLVRKLSPRAANDPVLHGTTPEGDPDQLFVDADWMTRRNDISRRAYKIIKQGRCDLGYVDGIFLRQRRSFNIKLPPYTIMWKNATGVAYSDMTMGATYLFARYFNILGTAASTNIPNLAIDETIWFNPLG